MGCNQYWQRTLRAGLVLRGHAEIVRLHAVITVFVRLLSAWRMLISGELHLALSALSYALKLIMKTSDRCQEHENQHRTPEAIESRIQS